jgi:L-amino acid N-acyltransferase YncA
MPRGSAHGLQGFRVHEKFLFASFRGKGLGAAAERAVVQQLPANPDDVVFGSIEEGNRPSQRCAYRVGRVDIGAKLWLTPPGRTGMPT